MWLSEYSKNSIRDTSNVIKILFIKYYTFIQNKDVEIINNNLEELNTLFYIYATMLYGEWLNSQSDFVGVEFSKGSFEMVEYQTEKDV